MLNPGKRECHLCYEDQLKYNIPIPNCQNPDGDGKECEYPKMSESLFRENLSAWNLWSQNAGQLIKVDANMAGAMFTLNLESLRCLMELMEVDNQLDMYRKIRAIFHVWKGLQQKQDSPKTNESIRKAQLARKRDL